MSSLVWDMHSYEYRIIHIYVGWFDVQPNFGMYGFGGIGAGLHLGGFIPISPENFSSGPLAFLWQTFFAFIILGHIDFVTVKIRLTRDHPKSCLELVLIIVPNSFLSTDQSLLCRTITVSSKTKASQRVAIMHLGRESLAATVKAGCVWKVLDSFLRTMPSLNTICTWPSSNNSSIV